MADRPVRRLRFVVPAVLLALIVIGATVVVVRWPSVAALACPECYGLQALQPEVYGERDLPPEPRDKIIRVTAEARTKITDFYGTPVSRPRILACTSADCYRRIGGGPEAGVAIMNRGLMLSPRGVDAVIAAHELSHVEFRQRAGGAAVPQWFDEGLAVLVSGDERYLKPADAADRCRVAPDGPLPETLGDWLAAASADEQTYARAACAVDRWARSRGGPAAINALADRLAAGASFRDATR
ncbi:hypothetical protein [Microlunatus sp. GCM10028923]|uniref:hypothetical protein n=1 Tax=Microlunatus sp. GCM10028923 TaxID=3273400 RepID=UPI0036097469